LNFDDNYITFQAISDTPLPLNEYIRRIETQIREKLLLKNIMLYRSSLAIGNDSKKYCVFDIEKKHAMELFKTLKQRDDNLSLKISVCNSYPCLENVKSRSNEYHSGTRGKFMGTTSSSPRKNFVNNQESRFNGRKDKETFGSSRRTTGGRNDGYKQRDKAYFPKY
jgi:hypothetical protein